MTAHRASPRRLIPMGTVVKPTLPVKGISNVRLLTHRFGKEKFCQPPV